MDNKKYCELLKKELKKYQNIIIDDSKGEIKLLYEDKHDNDG